MTNVTPIAKHTSTAEHVNTLHSEITTMAGSMLSRAFKIGELLKAEKKKQGHGNWLPYVKEFLSFDRTQSGKYLSLYENKDLLPNYQHTGNLSIDNAFKEINKLKPKKAKTENPVKLKPEQKAKPVETTPKPALDVAALSQKIYATVSKRTAQELGLNDFARRGMVMAHEKVVNLIDGLGKRDAKAALTAVIAVMEELDCAYRAEVAQGVEDAMETSVKRKEECLERREASLANRTKRSRNLKAVLSDKDIKLIQMCLHPDRAPEARKDKFTNALAAFNKAI